VLNDVVYYNGSAYIAKTSTTGNLPTSTSHWNQFSAGSGGIWNSGLSIGTAGQVVKVNSGASALEFGTISSDYVLLQQTSNTSSVPTVSYDNIFTSDYDHYVAHITKYNTGGDGGSLHFRWRSSGSALTANNYYGGWNACTATSGSSSFTGNTQWGIGYTHIGNGSNNGNYPSNCIINFHRPLENRPSITFTCTNWDGTSQMRLLVGGSVYMNAQSADGFQYSDSSGGNMTNTGEITIYGKKNS
jgi:hypothetical protein